MAVDEVLPGGNQPRRVAPDPLDVEEGDRLGLGAQPGAQQLGAVGAEGDEDRLAGVQPRPQVGERRLEEAIGIVVELHLMAEGQNAT